MLETALSAFVTFLVIVDPLGNAPLFVALTRGHDAAERRRTALRASLVAAVVLLAFALAGTQVLGAMGIGMAALRIAGGVLLFLLAVDMVFARSSGLRATTASEEREAVAREDVAVFPLAVPLIAGPGAIASVILLGGGAAEPGRLAVVLAALLLVLALNLAALLLADAVLRLIGVTGVNVLSRVFGIVLAALAVQLVLDGLLQGLPALSQAATA